MKSEGIARVFSTRLCHWDTRFHHGDLESIFDEPPCSDCAQRAAANNDGVWLVFYVTVLQIHVFGAIIELKLCCDANRQVTASLAEKRSHCFRVFLILNCVATETLPFLTVSLTSRGSFEMSGADRCVLCMLETEFGFATSGFYNTNRQRFPTLKLRGEV